MTTIVSSKKKKRNRNEGGGGSRVELEKIYSRHGSRVISLLADTFAWPPTATGSFCTSAPLDFWARWAMMRPPVSFDFREIKARPAAVAVAQCQCQCRSGELWLISLQQQHQQLKQLKQHTSNQGFQGNDLLFHITQNISQRVSFCHNAAWNSLELYAKNKTDHRFKKYNVLHYCDF